jgi:chromosome segregation ATPase
LIVLVPIGVSAQPTTGTTSEPTLSPASAYFNAADDSLMVLVDYRSQDDIQKDLAGAVGDQASAVQQLERAKMLTSLAETRIRLKEMEIKSFDTQIGLAKNEKNELKKKDFEARKKFAESEKQLLERRRDLRKRESDVAEARKEYSEASATRSQIELELSAKRQERTAFGSAVHPAIASEFDRLQSEIAGLEENVLNAQIEEAKKWKDVADREAQLAKIRKSVFQSQAKLTRGK